MDLIIFKILFRNRSRKNRERSSEGRKKQIQSGESNAATQDSAIATSSKIHHSRHGKRRSRGRDETTDLFIETPVTRVLQEVPDDIQDTPRNKLSRELQYFCHGINFSRILPVFP